MGFPSVVLLAHAHVSRVPVTVDLAQKLGLLERLPQFRFHKGTQKAHFLTLESLKVEIQSFTHPQITQIVVKGLLTDSDLPGSLQKRHSLNSIPIVFFCHLAPTLNLSSHLLNSSLS